MSAMTVGEFLQRFENPFQTVFVREDSTILEVLETMIAKGEERLVYVVDSQNVLKGVISTGRLARHFFHEAVSPNRGFSPSSSILHYLTAEHAKDIMDSDVLYCTMDDQLDSVVEKMFAKSVKKTIPVVDADMHVIDALNIISVMDVRLSDNEAV